MGFFDLFKKKQILVEDSKNEISDFFKVDINNLFQYSPVYSHSETSSLGNEVKHYNLKLKELELGIFLEIEIIKVGENECNLIFKGVRNEMTSDLSEFISFCTKKYGLDMSGNGVITETEYEDIKHNVFSRMWDKVWIDNMTSNNIIMTIFSCCQKYEK